MSGHRVTKSRAVTFPEDAQVIEIIAGGAKHQREIVYALRKEYDEDTIVRCLRRLSKKGKLRYHNQKDGWSVNTPPTRRTT